MLMLIGYLSPSGCTFTNMTEISDGRVDGERVVTVVGVGGTANYEA